MRFLTKMTDHQDMGRTDIPFDLLMKIQTGTMDYSYKDVPTLKNPFDLALYSKLIWNTKPRTILEIGSNAGGSALWMADQCDVMDIPAKIWSLDINPVTDVTHERVTFIAGDGRNLEKTWSRNWIAELPQPLIVIEDADHHYETTLAALEHFSSLIGTEDWIIVEDGILTAMGVEDDYGGGPCRAIKEFLASPSGENFMIDRSYCDFFGSNVTWNTDGFLRLKA